ncbi:MAG: hypothetical protein ACOC1F_06115 [Myxococcota bacterium]
MNRNHDAVLKGILKGAATTVIGQAKPHNSLYHHYVALVEGKTKPNFAKLTIACQIAAIALAVLKTQEEYDPKKPGVESKSEVSIHWTTGPNSFRSPHG